MSQHLAGTVIDLTQAIYSGMPVYKGHLETVIWTHATHGETASAFDDGFSFETRGLTLCDHGPTHVDAINHLDPSPGAPSVDAMALELFCGPATCIDISAAGPGEYVTAAALDAALSRTGVELVSDMILLLHTGTYERCGGTPEYVTSYPGLDADASRWLLERRVKAFGVDSPSPDLPASRTYPCHMMCRANGIHHYENLANLASVIGRRFTFVGLPLSIRGGTGSPVRAVAFLEAGDAG